MGVDQAGKRKRKKTGGRKRRLRKKRAHEMGSLPTLTTIGKGKKMVKKGIGSTKKHQARSTEKANVLDPSTKKYKVVAIKKVAESPSNREFARRGILTKGSVIETELGKARITSRPGQHGVVNAVLTETAKAKPAEK